MLNCCSEKESSSLVLVIIKMSNTFGDAHCNISKKFFNRIINDLTRY